MTSANVVLDHYLWKRKIKNPKIYIKKKSKKINIINGGRYDRLIFDLGSKKQVPAVGAALNLNY